MDSNNDIWVVNRDDDPNPHGPKSHDVPRFTLRIKIEGDARLRSFFDLPRSDTEGPHAILCVAAEYHPWVRSQQLEPLPRGSVVRRTDPPLDPEGDRSGESDQHYVHAEGDQRIDARPGGAQADRYTEVG